MLNKLTVANPGDSLQELDTFKEKQLYLKAQRKKLSKKTKRIVGGALLGGSILGAFITLLIVQENNDIDLGLLIVWCTLIVMAITGIVFLLAGLNWR
ncbi:MAG: hypothetical protein HUJ25_06545 [Crocinitomicaceae bacterium]|nr:hypothetical protein [Crocinitomicaceae bacterium]